MNKVMLYGKAIGIVIKKRYEKRKVKRKEMQVERWGTEDDKRKNAHIFHVILGGFAVIAICASGILLSKTVIHMETLHASVAEPMELDDPGVEGATVTKEGVVIREVPLEELTQNQEKSKTIVEQKVPLSAVQGKNDELADWKHIDGITVEANSVLQSQTEKSYDPENLLDGDVSTNWQEGEEGDGEGTMLTFSFPEDVSLRAFTIVNGNGASKEKYEADNRPRNIIIEIGTERIAYILKDTFGSQVVMLNHAITAHQVKIKIESVYKGSVYQDTCISDIDFYAE